MSDQAANIQDRFLELNRQSLVYKAVRASMPGNSKGTKNKCWNLDMSTLIECVNMHMFEHKSAQKIFDAMRDRFDQAGVQKRSLDSWLNRLRAAYAEEEAAYMEEVMASESIAFASGDLTAVLAVTMAAIAPRWIKYACRMQLDECDKDDRQSILRFLETQIKAAEVQAKAKHNEALTKRVMQQLREKIKIAGDEKRPARDREEAQKEISSIIDEAMGVKNTA